MRKRSSILLTNSRHALYRARFEIATVGLLYLVAVTVGAVMAHEGNTFALGRRDALVAQAQTNDPAAIAHKNGQDWKAAALDFGRNLLFGALPATFTGLTVISPYGFAAYRGWVGGIVSVDRQHQSRFSDFKRALYYILTLLLQLIPYTLAGGTGVKLGLTYFRHYKEYRDSPRWLGYPVEALLDVARIYALIIPLFLLASLWEFLSRWS